MPKEMCAILILGSSRRLLIILVVITIFSWLKLNLTKSNLLIFIKYIMKMIYPFLVYHNKKRKTFGSLSALLPSCLDSCSTVRYPWIQLKALIYISLLSCWNTLLQKSSLFTCPCTCLLTLTIGRYPPFTSIIDRGDLWPTSENGQEHRHTHSRSTFQRVVEGALIKILLLSPIICGYTPGNYPKYATTGTADCTHCLGIGCLGHYQALHFSPMQLA